MSFKSQVTQEEQEYDQPPAAFWALVVLFSVGIGYWPAPDTWQFWGMLGSGSAATLVYAWGLFTKAGGDQNDPQHDNCSH